MRDIGGMVRSALVTLLLALATGVLPPSTPAALAAPPSTLGIVFVNGMGNAAPEAMDPAGPMAETPEANLSKFFNLTQKLGYRVFMIRSVAETSALDGVIASKGELEPNGDALGTFLRRVKSEEKVSEVVIVAHSMGGLVSRQFIEHEYDPADTTLPRVVKLITLGTPHAGFHPYADGVIKIGSSLAEDYNLDFPGVIKEMTPARMSAFNLWSYRNPQVPYVLIGSHVHPKWSALKLNVIKRKSLETLWNTIWRWNKKDLVTDGLVFEPSSRGYAFAGTQNGKAVLNTVFTKDRSVKRYSPPGKWHGLPKAEQAEIWNIKHKDTLTFDADVFGKYVKPELEALHNARLLQVGPGGLYSYDAWTGRSSLLIKGMRPNGTPAGMLYRSPNKKSIVTLGGWRSDRAGRSSIRISRYPKGTAFRIDPGKMCGFSGWIDDYHAVIWIDETTYKVDSRTGKKVRYSGRVKYPRKDSRSTAGDKQYRVEVTDNQVAVTVRSTGQSVAAFKAPGTGGPWDWSTDSGSCSVSPDGRYIAFENMAMPYHDSRVEWSVWVCTLQGDSATQMAFGDGGFCWR